MNEFGDELLRRMKRFTEQLKSSEEMSIDEALDMAENGNWHGFEHLQNAAKIMADEVELLRAKVQEETAAADNLNEMLRRTGYGQGQIDSYDAQCVEIDELKEQLLDAKAEVVNLNEEIDEIIAQLAAAKAELLDACKLAIKDMDAWGIHGPGRKAIETAIKKAVGELDCE